MYSLFFILWNVSKRTRHATLFPEWGIEWILFQLNNYFLDVIMAWKYFLKLHQQRRRPAKEPLDAFDACVIADDKCRAYFYIVTRVWRVTWRVTLRRGWLSWCYTPQWRLPCHAASWRHYLSVNYSLTTVARVVPGMSSRHSFRLANDIAELA